MLIGSDRLIASPRCPVLDVDADDRAAVVLWLFVLARLLRSRRACADFLDSSVFSIGPAFQSAYTAGHSLIPARSHDHIEAL